MLSKFKIKYNTGLETEVVSSDCHSVEALALAMFGTETPDAEITQVTDEDPAAEKATAAKKTAK